MRVDDETGVRDEKMMRRRRGEGSVWHCLPFFHFIPRSLITDTLPYHHLSLPSPLPSIINSPFRHHLSLPSSTLPSAITSPFHHLLSLPSSPLPTITTSSPYHHLISLFLTDQPHLMGSLDAQYED
ncbi:hypothetical protein Pcinc_042767 [Petrolisthes cinctipes]|uniref:Uncharacterized protein n=1 Tax=Petrolisthes cinctipes TaxID=88211 RepID=A0AAE1BGU9_PETCI|nr:hypothetical protein Pcinc_042767 [Petrolisthes cinctipes]